MIPSYKDCGSLYLKSPKVHELGRDHSSKYGHILYASTLGHTETIDRTFQAKVLLGLGIMAG